MKQKIEKTSLIYVSPQKGYSKMISKLRLKNHKIRK